MPHGGRRAFDVSKNTTRSPRARTSWIPMDARDAPWEELIARNQYSVKSWLGYLQHKAGASPLARYVVYERALLHLNRSYKIWRAYLQERTKALANKCISDKRYDQLIDAYDRCLEHMNQMPRLWLDYLQILIKLRRGTLSRRVFDRAIQSLPVTQHEELWETFLPYVRDAFAVATTTQHIYERYLLFAPEHREGYITYLIEQRQPVQAAKQLIIALADPQFAAPSGRTRHALTLQLCEILAEASHLLPPDINAPAIIKNAIATYANTEGGEVGRLWCRLADFYVRSGNFLQARATYEAGMEAVRSVRDFGIVFDSYIKVEEGVVTALMEMQAEEEEEDDEEERANIDVRLAELEALLERRPLLVNSVLLRQNPHNVSEWHKRLALLADGGVSGDAKTQTDSGEAAVASSVAPESKNACYLRALATVDPALATGKFSSLHMSYARFLENRDVSAARAAYSAASKVAFKTVEELASIYCGWAEFEIRHKQFESARNVMQQAVTEPRGSVHRRKAIAAAQGRGNQSAEEGAFEGATSADRLFRNGKVWAFYLDLEESLGTQETVRAAYDRAMQLKVITIQMCLNYASYLEDSEYYEEAFKVYERSAALFPFLRAVVDSNGNTSAKVATATSGVRQIWITYINKFVERYGGSKLERLRDILEQAVSNAPATDAAELYLLYAKIEESYGLPRHALAVYERATRAVSADCRLDMYRLYISKVSALHGPALTRPVYESAVALLDDQSAGSLCLDFAAAETLLGDINRARAVYQHGSQFANPRRAPHYWTAWQSFEERYGNEDTYRDMLRMQRTVETRYAQVSYAQEDAVAAAAKRAAAAANGQHRSSRAAGTSSGTTGSGSDDSNRAALKRSFVKAGFDAEAEAEADADSPENGSAEAAAQELDIDDVNVVTSAIPASVFGR